VRHEQSGGVQVERYGLFVPSEPSRLLPRLVHELSFPLSLLRALFRGPRHDVMVVFCPLLGAVVFGALRKTLRGEPMWVNVQDIPLDAAVGTGIGRSGLFARAAARIQSALLARANACSSISPPMVERLAQPGRPVELHPNWLSRSLARCVDGQPSKVGRPPGSPLKLLYAGNIGKKQGLLDFCQRVARTDLELGSASTATARARAPGRGSRAARPAPSWGRSWEPDFVQALHDTDVFVITGDRAPGLPSCPASCPLHRQPGTPSCACATRRSAGTGR
jgi:hypothetical protein